VTVRWCVTMSDYYRSAYIDEEFQLINLVANNLSDFDQNEILTAFDVRTMQKLARRFIDLQRRPT